MRRSRRARSCTIPAPIVLTPPDAGTSPASRPAISRAHGIPASARCDIRSATARPARRLRQPGLSQGAGGLRAADHRAARARLRDRARATPVPTWWWSTPAASSSPPSTNRCRRSARRSSSNGRVLVTGCLGANPQRILERHPKVLGVTGPHAYERVIAAVNEHLPRPHDAVHRPGAAAGHPAHARDTTRI